MADGILILAEHLKGELADITFEMLGRGPEAGGRPGRAAARGAGRQATSLRLRPRLGLADEVLVVSAPALEMPAASTLAALLKSLMEKESAGAGAAGRDERYDGGRLDPLGADGPALRQLLARTRRGTGATCSSPASCSAGRSSRMSASRTGRGIVSVYPGSFPADAGRSDKAPPVRDRGGAAGGLAGRLQGVHRAAGRRRRHHEAGHPRGRRPRHPDPGQHRPGRGARRAAGWRGLRLAPGHRPGLAAADPAGRQVGHDRQAQALPGAGHQRRAGAPGGHEGLAR